MDYNTFVEENKIDLIIVYVRYIITFNNLITLEDFYLFAYNNRQ